MEDPNLEPYAIRCVGCQQVDTFRDDKIGKSDKGKPWIRVVLYPVNRLRGIREDGPRIG